MCLMCCLHISLITKVYEKNVATILLAIFLVAATLKSLYDV